MYKGLFLLSLKKNFSDKRVFRRFEFSDKYQNCVLSQT